MIINQDENQNVLIKLVEQLNFKTSEPTEILQNMLLGVNIVNKLFQFLNEQSGHNLLKSDVNVKKQVEKLLSGAIKSKEMLIEEIKNKEDEIKELSSEISSKEEERKKLSEKLDHLKDQLLQLEAGIAESEKKVGKIQSEIEERQKTFQELNKEYESLLKKVNELKAEYEELKKIHEHNLKIWNTHFQEDQKLLNDLIEDEEQKQKIFEKISLLEKLLKEIDAYITSAIKINEKSPITEFLTYKK